MYTGTHSGVKILGLKKCDGRMLTWLTGDRSFWDRASAGLSITYKCTCTGKSGAFVAQSKWTIPKVDAKLSRTCEVSYMYYILKLLKLPFQYVKKFVNGGQWWRLQQRQEVQFRRDFAGHRNYHATEYITLTRILNRCICSILNTLVGFLSFSFIF